MLILELESKTSCPYEILVWLNTPDQELIEFILDRQMNDVPIRVLGITPENIGMHAFKKLFASAKYPIITQIDDDVIRISPGIAEEAAKLFAKYPEVQQIVADVYQDQWTTGSRPPMDTYSCFNQHDGLYDGLIDGWFSMYRNTPLMMETLMEIPYKKYEFIGSWARHLLINKGYKGLLCTKFKVLHLSGPFYAHLFGRLGFEIEKYRSVGRNDVVEAYLHLEKSIPSIDILEYAKLQAFDVIDSWDIDQIHP